MKKKKWKTNFKRKTGQKPDQLPQQDPCKLYTKTLGSTETDLMSSVDKFIFLDKSLSLYAESLEFSPAGSP